MATLQEATLEGKTALITGGGSGIGRETALLMASVGAHVVVCERDEEGGRTTVTRIQEAGGRAHLVVADVSDDAQMRNAAGPHLLCPLRVDVQQDALTV